MPEDAATRTKEVRLDYAPLDAVRRRRRLRRAVLTVGLLALVVAGGWYGPTLWRRAKTMYAVRYACGYGAPPDTVVYQDDPSTARPLLANAGPAASGTTPATAPAAASAPDPAAFNRLAAVADIGYVTLFARGTAPSPLVFLHERTAPDGRRLLVAVRITGLTYYAWDGGTLACSYNGLLLQPKDWNAPTGVSLIRAWGGVHIPSAGKVSSPATPRTPDPDAPAAPGEVRIFFGAADANDASAFTVPYEVNGRKKQWRFRVTNQGLDLAEQEKGENPD